MRHAAFASLLLHAVLLIALAGAHLPARPEVPAVPVTVTLVLGAQPSAAGASGGTGTSGTAGGATAQTTATDAASLAAPPEDAAREIAAPPPEASHPPAHAPPAPAQEAVRRASPAPATQHARAARPRQAGRRHATVQSDATPSHPSGSKSAARDPAAQAGVPVPNPGGSTGAGAGRGEAGSGRGAVGDGPPDAIGDDYLERVRRYIGRYKRYPDDAVRRKEEGRVVLAFTIARDGSILAATVEHSSGHREIDSAALDMLSAASPVPPLPPTFRGDRITVAMPFAFSLSFFDRLF